VHRSAWTAGVLLLLGALEAACKNSADVGSAFDGGWPDTDASCPVPCEAGRVCEYPGAFSGSLGDAGTPTCEPMPEACASDPGCGCLVTALCGSVGIGIACGYNPDEAVWTAQCITQ
jgi:hypothetical protein